MTPRRVMKLARMDAKEVAWRSQAAARVAVDRAAACVKTPRWDRQRLAKVLGPEQRLAPVRQAATAGRWLDAHTALASLILESPQRFTIARGNSRTTVRQIWAEFPGAPRDAAARADRILAGQYDLLGYRGLRFAPSGGDPSRVDWHYDPVHARRAPRSFWSTVPFLSPTCGDHKIIWELNRHQHWLTLGRAYWLTGDDRYRTRALLELASWLEANPPLSGINWSSMLELAFRSLSWIWAVHFFVGDEDADGSPWLVDLVIGLDRQLQQIARNLSRYFSPNTHLLGEALALYVAGRTFPWLSAAARFADLGRSILVQEISRQIAADGGHCERSTHYHRYTLDFYLLALVVAYNTDDPVAAQFEEAATRLGFAARLLADSRGSLPHFGDDDGGSTWPLTGRPVDDIRDSLAIASVLTRQRDLRVGPLPEEAFWILAHPSFMSTLEASHTAGDRLGSGALRDTGYYVSRSAAGDHLVIDAGPHGYQNGGHAHADALSLTMSVRGVPLLIDPGTGCYTIDERRRNHLRSTALHNTLTLDGAPQSVPGGPFHWHTTASAAARRWRTNPAFDYFEGAHDGYRPIAHRRHVLALHGDLVLVADLLAAPSPDVNLHRADVHWHLDPRWTASIRGRHATCALGGDRIQVISPHGLMESFSADDSGLGWHAPVYGRIEPATTIRIGHSSSVPFWMVTVFGLNAANEMLDVDTLPVWAEAGVLGHAVAVRILRAGGADYCLIADPAGAAAPRSWRVAEFETDAAMLFCRADNAGRLTRLALVDGTRVRCGGGQRLQLTMPARTPHLHLDLSGEQARLGGPSTGACVSLAGRVLSVARERRGLARGRAAARSL